MVTVYERLPTELMKRVDELLDTHIYDQEGRPLYRECMNELVFNADKYEKFYSAHNATFGVFVCRYYKYPCDFV